MILVKLELVWQLRVSKKGHSSEWNETFLARSLILSSVLYTDRTRSPAMTSVRLHVNVLTGKVLWKGQNG